MGDPMTQSRQEEMSSVVASLRAASRRARSQAGRSRLPFHAAWTGFLIALAFIVLLPLIRVQVGPFADSMAGFFDALALPGIGTISANTIALGIGSTVIAVLLGTYLAWIVSRLPPKTKRILSIVPLMPLVVPAVAAVSGWVFLLSPTAGYLNGALRATPFFNGGNGPINVYSIMGIVVITGFVLTSYVYLFVYTRLREMGEELTTAALASGASRTRAFFTITVPQLKPAIIYASGITLLLGLGQFTAPLLLGRTQRIDVITTAMYRMTIDYPVQYDVAAALATPLVILGIGIVIFQTKIIGRGDRYTSTAAKGSHPAQTSKGGSIWHSVFIVGYGVLATALPVAALSYVALSPFWSGRLEWSGLTFDNLRWVLDSDLAVGAISNSVIVSAIAVAILLPVGSLAAWGLVNRELLPRPLTWLLDITVSMPLAVPAALIGFGLLYTYTRPPVILYGTKAVLVITYFIIMIPFVTRLMTTTLLGIGEDVFSASRACGGGRVRTLLQIGAPLARKGMASAAALSVVLLIHEFSASLMVRSARTQVMGSLLYDQWTGGLYPRAAVVALLMVVITAAGVAAALVIGGRDALERM